MTAPVVAVLFALWAGATLLVLTLLFAMGEYEQRHRSRGDDDTEE